MQPTTTNSGQGRQTRWIKLTGCYPHPLPGSTPYIYPICTVNIGVRPSAYEETALHMHLIRVMITMCECVTNTLCNNVLLLSGPGNQAAGRFLILSYFYCFLILRSELVAGTYCVACRQVAVWRTRGVATRWRLGKDR